MRTEIVDVCVIGSGAGGAVIAHESARRGLRTLILERGPYVRSEAMSHRELEMIPRLYKDGGLQLNSGMNMFIMQGSCVGGSTVLSNMVLLRAGERVLEEWRRFGADVATLDLVRGYERVERDLEAAIPHPSNVSRSSRLFMEGAKALGLDPRWMLKALGDCVGCGDCNIGCGFGTKKSALTTYVAWAEAEGARVLAETTAERIETSRGRARTIHATVGRRREKLRIEADVVVVAGGAIGSSALLLKSGVRKNVGTRLSFNAGSMIVADFADPLDAYDADQMTLYLQKDDYIIEATHNPIMSLALTTPGWTTDHGRMMRGQRNLAYAGALVGTQPVGRVVMSPFFGHEEVRFKMPTSDLASLRAGLETTARVFFAAGARRIFLPTHELKALTSPRELGILRAAITSVDDISFGSAHPQGGNPMSDDPKLGVVDRNFAVHGYENLFVCDASVFPSTVRVNPMHTVLALAHDAAPRILARARGWRTAWAS